MNEGFRTGLFFTLMAFAWAVLYFLTTIVEAQIDPFLWREVTRQLFAFLAAASIIFCAIFSAPF